MAVKIRPSKNDGTKKTHSEIVWRKPTCVSQLLAFLAYVLPAFCLYFYVTNRLQGQLLCAALISSALLGMVSGALEGKQENLGAYDLRYDATAKRIFQYTIISGLAGVVGISSILFVLFIPIGNGVKVIFVITVLVCSLVSFVVRALRDRMCAQLVSRAPTSPTQ
jgi:hypothetical protein